MVRRDPRADIETIIIRLDNYHTLPDETYLLSHREREREGFRYLSSPETGWGAKCFAVR